MVAGEHAPDLRHRHVRLVDDQQDVVGEEVEQRVRRLARLAAGEVPAVVLDARAVADLQQHLHVVPRPRRQPLGFEQLALLLELLAAARPAPCRSPRRPPGSAPRAGRSAWPGRCTSPGASRARSPVSGSIDRQPLDLVAEQLDPVADLLVGRPELDHVAADAELAALEGRRRCGRTGCRRASAASRRGRSMSPTLEADHHLAVVVGRAQAVDARHAGDDDHVLAADQGTGGRPAAAGRSPR